MRRGGHFDRLFYWRTLASKFRRLTSKVEKVRRQVIIDFLFIITYTIVTKRKEITKMKYISLFNDRIRIGVGIDWGDRLFGFSLDNGIFDYDQFNFKWFYICWLKRR